jgi:hypothetical protein
VSKKKRSMQMMKPPKSQLLSLPSTPHNLSEADMQRAVRALGPNLLANGFSACVLVGYRRSTPEERAANPLPDRVFYCPIGFKDIFSVGALLDKAAEDLRNGLAKATIEKEGKKA